MHYYNFSGTEAVSPEDREVMRLVNDNRQRPQTIATAMSEEDARRLILAGQENEELHRQLDELEAREDIRRTIRRAVAPAACLIPIILYIVSAVQGWCTVAFAAVTCIPWAVAAVALALPHVKKEEY